MISRALAALALGGLLFIILPGCFQTGEASQLQTVSPEIIERYQKTLAADQDNLTLHYLLGVALLQDNQNEAALAKLQTAYPAYQQSIEAHYNLTIAALRLGDLVSAEIYLEQAEELGAMDTPGLYPVAGLYFNMAIKAQQAGEANEAIRYFHKVLDLNPQQLEVYRQLGDLYANRNDTELALKSFRKYLEHFPEDAISRDYLFALEFNKAQDLLAENDLNQAAEGFSAAIELQPDSPAALYYLGYIAYSQDKPEQAAKFLERAFPASEETVKQSIRPLLYNTALSLRSATKLQAALDAITTLAEQENAFFNELFLAGTINLELRQFRKAQTYLQQAVTMKPEDQAAQQNLLAAELEAFNEWLSEARLKLNAEDFSGAEHALQKAAFLQPQNNKVGILEKQVRRAREDKASGYFDSARTAFGRGDFNLAANKVAAGLTIQPDNNDGLVLRETISAAMEVDLNNLLAEAAQLSKAGSFDKAADSYAQVLAIVPLHQAALQGLKETNRARQKQAREFLNEGLRALDDGQADLAAAAFVQALASDPELEQARQGLESAEEMRANRLEEYFLKGRQALSSNRFEEARKWFHQALRTDDSPRVQRELARLDKLSLKKADELAIKAESAARKGQFKKSQRLFTQALKLVPEHQRSLTGQADVALAVKSSVKEQLKQASISMDQNDFSSAMTRYRAILDIAPQNATALDGLEKIRALQAAELDDQVRNGQEALAAGDWTLAEEHLQNALKKDAYHKGAQQLRQRLEQVRQSGAQPGDEQGVYLQGVAYYTQGQYAQAIKAWETVLLLNPEHKKSIQNIDKTRRKIRQIEEYRGN
jgi:tetratricopeptide (TPR) repeat protein